MFQTQKSVLVSIAGENVGFRDDFSVIFNVVYQMIRPLETLEQWILI